jgi:hypothetical protein
MLGYWPYATRKNIFFIYFFLSKHKHHKTERKTIQAIHIHSKICKRPKTLMYIKK